MLLCRLADGIRLAVGPDPLQYWPGLYKISGSAAAFERPEPASSDLVIFVTMNGR